MIRKGTRLAVVVAAMALVACLPQGDASQDGYAVGPGAAESDPSQVVTARAACEARGGEWRNAGISGLMTCFTTPRDAGKTCERSSDCETECLARSRSCSPVSPLLGCNDVLDASGTHGDPMRGLIRPKAIALLAALGACGLCRCARSDGNAGCLRADVLAGRLRCQGLCRALV